ncbi:Hypothetical predicted protein [Pelobates cultripes]|uniref:Uncharacterized protein n=1 Tax=Pelobates cultripes TaxID=61616 RepID=A0AAD1RTU3_PELCU|nr:Hypothetical predicted protein [Pelobates cultripes]
MVDFANAHNELVDKFKAMEEVIESEKLKIADLKDRFRRNNLRIQGIPKTVADTSLHIYLLDFFQVLLPEIHLDQIFIDRAHRLRRPKHLPPSAARDVITRIHYFHVKERILKASL